MGYRTVLVVNMDYLHEIEKDASLGKKISDAISSFYDDKKVTRIFNVGAVMGSFHYQDAGAFLFGGPFSGNYLNLIGIDAKNIDKNTDVGLILLKYLANKYGYDLKEKNE